MTPYRKLFNELDDETLQALRKGKPESVPQYESLMNALFSTSGVWMFKDLFFEGVTANVVGLMFGSKTSVNIERDEATRTLTMNANRNGVLASVDITEKDFESKAVSVAFMDGLLSLEMELRKNCQSTKGESDGQ